MRESTDPHRLFEYEGHWLVQRSDTPNYHIYWCKPGTRRVRRKSAGTSDLEEAKRRLIAFVHERKRPKGQRAEDVPVLDVLTDYIEKTLRGRPGEEHARTALGHLYRFFEREEIEFISDLTLDAQDRYIAWRRATGRGVGGKALSNDTIARELSVLRAAVRQFWKRGYLEQAPYIRGLPKAPPRDRYLTAGEAQRLIAACEEPHLRRFVLLALHTLQRPSAVLGLRVEQVNLEAGRIDFLPPGERQSNKRRPVVPITTTLRPILEDAMRESETGFVIEYDGRPVQNVKRSFRGACDRAGLKGVTPYTLRHTGATLLAAAGVSMRQIAGVLGHTTQRTTEIYAKHSPEFLQDAAGALDRLFGKAEETPQGDVCAPNARQREATPMPPSRLRAA